MSLPGTQQTACLPGRPSAMWRTGSCRGGSLSPTESHNSKLVNSWLNNVSSDSTTCSLHAESVKKGSEGRKEEEKVGDRKANDKKDTAKKERR